jgi:hypothetical protein
MRTEELAAACVYRWAASVLFEDASPTTLSFTLSGIAVAGVSPLLETPPSNNESKLVVTPPSSAPKNNEASASASVHGSNGDIADGGVSQQAADKSQSLEETTRPLEEVLAKELLPDASTSETAAQEIPLDQCIGRGEMAKLHDDRVGFPVQSIEVDGILKTYELSSCKKQADSKLHRPPSPAVHVVARDLDKAFAQAEPLYSTASVQHDLDFHELRTGARAVTPLHPLRRPWCYQSYL